jgi:hypothetical protein
VREARWGHSFDVYDDQLVLVETVTAEVRVRDSDDVARGSPPTASRRAH